MSASFQPPDERTNTYFKGRLRLRATLNSCSKPSAYLRRRTTQMDPLLHLALPPHQQKPLRHRREHQRRLRPRLRQQLRRLLQRLLLQRPSCGRCPPATIATIPTTATRNSNSVCHHKNPSDRGCRTHAVATGRTFRKSTIHQLTSRATSHPLALQLHQRPLAAYRDVLVPTVKAQRRTRARRAPDSILWWRNGS